MFIQTGNPIITILHLLLSICSFAIIIRAILSWINPDPMNPIVRFIHKITDPILKPIQSIIPSFAGMDISPILALVLIQFIQRLLLRFAI
ncbi:MAG: YggT family protein [bacterium]|jgi:YggT family protein